MNCILYFQVYRLILITSLFKITISRLSVSCMHLTELELNFDISKR